MADYGSGTRTRFRYTGLTTSAAQWLDDAAGTVTRHIANGWLGERLADWTGSGSNLRIYGTNSHHDVTWLATNTGTVSQALRYDPWGNPRPGSAPSGYSPFRFQGSWFDATTSLNWSSPAGMPRASVASSARTPCSGPRPLGRPVHRHSTRRTHDGGAPLPCPVPIGLPARTSTAPANAQRHRRMPWGATLHLARFHSQP